MRQRLLGAGIASVVALVVWDKTEHHTLIELLWCCHLASIAEVAGLLAGRRSLAAAGLLCQLGIGIPAWVVDWLSGHPPGSISIAAHTLPATLTLIALWNEPLSWPRSVLPAWILFLGAEALAVACADPALNINVVWQAQPPFDQWFTQPWTARLFHSTAALLCVLAAALVLQLASVRARRASTAARPTPTGW